MARLIPHLGSTLGFRVGWQGHSVAYLSDHQQPFDGTYGASPSALELVSGVDLLIHDAQYTQTEFKAKSTWGHCTIDYAVWLAAEAGVKRLALFITIRRVATTTSTSCWHARARSASRAASRSSRHRKDSLSTLPSVAP
jgi:ribonuclease BN (tRNA processing enzyme)